MTAALLSLGVSAKEFNVTITEFNYNPDVNNDIILNDFIDFGEELLKAGDVINVKIKGYFNYDIKEIFYRGIVDNSPAANDWKPLSEMLWTKNGFSFEGGATVGEECEVETSVELIEDAVSNEKIIIRIVLQLSAAVQSEIKDTKIPLKLRATEAELGAAAVEHPVEMPTAKFTLDKENQFKVELEFTTENVIKKDDILKLHVNGKFNATVLRFFVMIYEGGDVIMKWTEQTFTAGADATVDEYVSIIVPAAFTGTSGKLILFTNYNPENAEVAPESLSFLKEGEEAHDPVELAKKEYTDVTLLYNQYADPANYQFIESEIASDVLVGDYVTFSINGVSNAAFSKMKVYLRNPEGYSAISSYVEILANTEANGTVSYSGKVEASSAAAKCDLVFEIPDEATEGSSIVIAPEGNVAVAEVAPAFAVEGGMVYSAGEIVVYNVAGKEIAKASKSFNVNSLAAGVYFITAKEGTIKFVK